MMIEILDDQGGVITKVANSGNPADDVALYGGASWRVYVQSDAERVNALRALKIVATRSEGMQRIGKVIPALAREDTLNLLVEMLRADMVTAPAPGSDMDTVREIYLYARQRIQDAQTATENQLNQYDPATDPGWPA